MGAFNARSRVFNIVGILAAVLFLAHTAPALATDFEQETTFSIVPQPLSTALLQFANITRIQVLSASTQLSGYHSPGAQGRMTARAALEAFLSGTGLSYQKVGEGTVTISLPAKGTFSMAAPGAAGDAPASQSAPFQSQGESRQSSQEGASNANIEGPSSKKYGDLEQVTVTGSHIALTQQQQAVPVNTYSSQDIDRSGQATLADFLNTLPQVSMNSTSGDLQVFAGQRGVRLHGLPLTATLTLIDGQSIELGDYGPMDLTLIPASAIERIDIIPVGSSAVYGSDALAGVVNIVLKKNLDGVEVNARYGSANDYNDKKFDVAFGKTFDKASFSVVVTQQRQSGLTFGDRSLTSSLDFVDRGGTDNRYTYCNPGTVYGVGGANLPGLGTNSAGIPAGVTGTPPPSSFAATAGAINKCNYFVHADAISPQEETGLIANAHYEIVPWLDVFASILYSHLDQDNATGPKLILTNGAYTVGANNPYNPFGVPVGIDYGWGTADYDRTANFLRPVLGARGDLGAGWHYELTSLYSVDRYHVLERHANPTAVQAALNASDPTQALNVFTPGAPGSAQLVNSLFTTLHDQYKNELTSVEAVANGPLFTLPEGPVKASFGTQYQRSSIFYHTVNGNGFAPPSGASRSTYALFGETRVPLLAGSAPAETGELLALSGAGRYDHSSDFGGKETYQGGLEWRPLRSLLVRGAFGTSYRAPSLVNLYGAQNTYNTVNVTDPYRGNSTYIVGYPTGPNSNLKPEEGHSTSLGLMYTSHELEGLESSLTYWKIHYDNYIGGAAIQDLATYPQDYPAGWVVRAPATAADQAKGWLGQIQSVFGGPVNFGKIDVNGFDFDLKYRIETRWGAWTPALAVTQTNQYSAALRPGQPEVSYVSQATTAPGWAPRWKGNTSLSWGRGAWTASVVGRYVGPYDDYKGYTGAYPHELGDFWIFDGNARVDVGKLLANEGSWWRDTYVSLGAVNLFNRQPQFSYYAYGYDTTQADLLGRYVYVQAGLKF